MSAVAPSSVPLSLWNHRLSSDRLSSVDIYSNERFKLRISLPQFTRDLCGEADHLWKTRLVYGVCPAARLLDSQGKLPLGHGFSQIASRDYFPRNYGGEYGDEIAVCRTVRQRTIKRFILVLSCEHRRINPSATAGLVGLMPSRLNRRFPPIHPHRHATIINGHTKTKCTKYNNAGVSQPVMSG